MDWFPPTDAYLKRTHIRKLIFELVENHGSHEGFSPDDGDNHHCSEYIDNRIGGQCHFFNEEASTSCSGKGIEMFPTYNTCNMVLKEHFEPKAAWGTSLRHCQSFDQRSLLHMNDSTDTINFPVDPLIDISQHSNMMSTGNKNWYPHLSYQGTPTLQLHHISDDAVDNNVINGDVQIIDNINLDFWNERPPKKRRLMPPWVEVMES